MHTLLLVPTERERLHLARQPGFGVDAPCALCGFGPVAAAANARHAIARHSPERVIVVGIAGTFDPVGLPIGSAAVFPAVVMHGIGVGGASSFVSAAKLGFRHWPPPMFRDNDPDAPDQLSLNCPVPPAGGPLLTCCTASSTSTEAAERRRQFPNAVAEDMEGFGVALAGHLAGVPIAIVRGISNQVGDREFERWQIQEALEAAYLVATDLLGRSTWNDMA
ncbi:MAG: futalosine hydrolase [Acidobacteriota bacterium]|nr:futalosine hydrolase [Acidobacteriota bacterium]